MAVVIENDKYSIVDKTGHFLTKKYNYEVNPDQIVRNEMILKQMDALDKDVAVGSYSDSFYYNKEKAEQGYPFYMLSVADCYQHGKNVNKSYEEALSWYEKFLEELELHEEYKCSKYYNIYLKKAMMQMAEIYGDKYDRFYDAQKSESLRKEAESIHADH